jgi:hypothetical protein
MTPLYVYAVVAGVARRPTWGRGMKRERLRLVRVGGLGAVVGDVNGAPPVTAPLLRAHDAVCRRIARAAHAALPCRFGSLSADEATLRRELERRRATLAAALVDVRGCVQMTLRVVIPARGRLPVDPSFEARLRALGPGARYLARRQRAHTIPELSPLRSLLADLVRRERVASPPGTRVVTVYHLVPHAQASTYADRIAQAARRLRPLRVVVSGPWPAYGFAPEELL